MPELGLKAGEWMCINPSISMFIFFLTPRFDHDSLGS
jgi:hypothetical protein